MTFYIYILYSPGFDKYYVGHSDNPWRRIQEHNSDQFQKYTTPYRPWVLKAVFAINGNRGEALKIEKLIKRQKSRAFIQKMLSPDFRPEGILSQLVKVPNIRY